jgi:hypothetical protein
MAELTLRAPPFDPIGPQSSRSFTAIVIIAVHASQQRAQCAKTVVRAPVSVHAATGSEFYCRLSDEVCAERGELASLVPSEADESDMPDQADVAPVGRVLPGGTVQSSQVY